MQTCVLLSYWSPFDSETQVSSYWAEKAICHAIAAQLPLNLDVGRHRVMWWCCLTRERLIAFAFRRLSPLRAGGQRYPRTEDFGSDGRGPNFTVIRGFNLLCKLTEIMTETLNLQRLSEENQAAMQGRAVDLLELVAVVKLRAKLETWKQEYRDACAEALIHLSASDSKAPFYVLNILAE